MKIKDLRVHSIAIADPPLRSSYGLHAPYALRTIIELESEDGIVGINETYGGEAPAAALLALKDLLVGANPFRITGLLNPEMKYKTKNQDRSQVDQFALKGSLLKWTGHADELPAHSCSREKSRVSDRRFSITSLRPPLATALGGTPG